jgi:hypothetical protein
MLILMRYLHLREILKELPTPSDGTGEAGLVKQFTSRITNM